MAEAKYPADSPVPAGALGQARLRPYLDNARTWLTVGSAVLAGLLLAIIWSFEVADSVLGANIASTALGRDVHDVQLSAGGPLLGMLFAFAAGLAATFTACNCAVFSCVAPLAARKQALQTSILRILGWMALGITLVTAAYGIAGVIFGTSLPVLSNAKLPIGSGEGYPARLAQSTVIFVVLGVIMTWWGLNTLNVVQNPLERLLADRQWLKSLLLGVMIGFFTIGRPFPLFRQAFEYAATTGNPVYSATAMALQGLGNIVVMVILLLVLLYGTGGRFERWMRSSADRVVMITAISLIVGGIFMVTYWGFRVPSYFGIGWFPHMPYK